MIRLIFFFPAREPIPPTLPYVRSTNKTLAYKEQRNIDKTKKHTDSGDGQAWGRGEEEGTHAKRMASATRPLTAPRYKHAQKVTKCLLSDYLCVLVRQHSTTMQVHTATQQHSHARGSRTYRTQVESTLARGVWGGGRWSCALVGQGVAETAAAAGKMLHTPRSTNRSLCHACRTFFLALLHGSLASYSLVLLFRCKP